MRPRGENIEYDKLRDRLTSDKARLQMRIGELESQAEIHWKTRRTLLAELAGYHKDSTKLISEYEVRVKALEAALNDLLPGLILDRRYADADDDIDAMNSRIETVTSALGAQSEPSVEPIKGGQLCHLCNAVHDLMSACPPDGWTCKACGYYQGRHLRCLNPDCITNDRGVAK